MGTTYYVTKKNKKLKKKRTLFEPKWNNFKLKMSKVYFREKFKRSILRIVSSELISKSAMSTGTDLS